MAEPAPCPTGGPAPEEPPEIHRDIDIWNPGGDPGALRRAAGAWRSMAGTMGSIRSTIDGQVGGVQWTGEAREAFDAWWGQYGSDLQEAEQVFNDVAAFLDQCADEIQRVNDQVHDLYVSIGVGIGIGIALSVVTLGFSTAAAAGSATMAAARAGQLVAALATFLRGMQASLGAVKAALIVFRNRWLIAAGANTAATMAQKAITNDNHNPLSGWTIGDVASIVNGASMAAGAAGVGDRIPAFAGFSQAHPTAAAFAAGAAGAGSASVLNDLQVRGQPFGWETMENAGVNALAGGVGGAGTQRVMGAFGARPASLPPATPTGPSVTPSGIILPGRPLPTGWTETPSGIAVPGPPAGWSSTPGGIVHPGPVVIPPRPATPPTWFQQLTNAQQEALVSPPFAAVTEGTFDPILDHWQGDAPPPPPPPRPRLPAGAR